MPEDWVDSVVQDPTSTADFNLRSVHAKGYFGFRNPPESLNPKQPRNLNHEHRVMELDAKRSPTSMDEGETTA